MRVIFISLLFLLQLSSAELTLDAISSDLKKLSESFKATLSKERQKRSETISSQTVYQYQKKQKKCKNLRSYGIASGGNALRYVDCRRYLLHHILLSLHFSYMSFVASVITLVLNINNNINANNNNNNQANINFGNNNNLLSNLNQNVGNNFNLMFPPGRKRRRRHTSDVDRMFEGLHIQAKCFL